MFSQDYPRIEKDSLNNDIVIMTIEQAQKLDNMSDLINLYKSLDNNCAQQEVICLQVVNDKERVIASQKLEITNLNTYNSTKENEILILQAQVNEYINNNSILTAQVDNRQATINERDLQIKHLKSKMIFGGAGGGLIVIALTFLLIK
jgi:SMC interacting uncharacterized protein involved in chromosome segregation